jgi:F-type H+-transporting ATPase subunit b
VLNLPAVLGTLVLAAEEVPGGEEEVANPILPTANELFYAALFFLILWALMKFVLLPPIRKIMDEREQKRLGDLQAAEAAAAQMAEAEERYESSLAGARAEAVAKVEAARSEADEYRRQTMASAEADAASTKAESAAEVAQARSDAMAQLRGSLTDIAVGAAEAVTERPVDRGAQAQVIEDYVNRAESGR